MYDAELLSAYLDGEVSDAEAEQVRTWLADDEAAHDELESLRQVRSVVRGLPEVHPPFGFYERMLLDAKKAPRRRSLSLAGAAAASVAAVVLLVGFAPSAAAMVPPVETYASRHAALDGKREVTLPVAESGGYRSMPVEQVTTMEAPYFAPERLGGTYARMAAFSSEAGVVHLVYGHDDTMMSVYEQRGSVQWSALPPAGHMVAMPGAKAWFMQSGRHAVLVVEQAPVVYTVVGASSADALMGMAGELPEAPSPSLAARVIDACTALNRQFGLDG